ncbi:MAG: hypothetical protein U5K37_10470 [Natrialbaceae archaeon]|nr:hypothetical protein [Natrialbaceae archaeon]
MTAADAADSARTALQDYEAIEILEQPYQQRGTWLVRAEADGQPVNIHIERRSGRTRIAEIDSRA